MLFPPIPRKHKRFIWLLFIGNSGWIKKKTEKGDLKEYFSRSFVIIFSKDFDYLFIREREQRDSTGTEGKGRGKERSQLPTEQEKSFVII